MAKSQGLGRSQRALMDSDIAVSQQLVRLSNEDNNNISGNKKSKEKNFDDKEFDKSSEDIEEIVRKEKDVLRRKKRRYRSFAGIYKGTTSISVGYGKATDYQQLMQLSEENDNNNDNNNYSNNNINNKSKNKRKSENSDGDKKKTGGKVRRRKRKYRSLTSIYKSTTPMNV